MAIEVRHLTPELVGDYMTLFDDVYDNDPWLRYKDNPGWGGCYCTFYDDAREEDAINAGPDKRGDNRANRTSTIHSGKASGLLAYIDGKVAGWCNVAPRGAYANPREVMRDEDEDGTKVGSITCFLVSHSNRNFGVASALLDSACSLVGSWGINVAEGYPRNPEAKVSTHDIPGANLVFRGSLGMFTRKGFKVYKAHSRMLVVRKKL